MQIPDPWKLCRAIRLSFQVVCASGYDCAGILLRAAIDYCRRTDYALDVTVQLQVLRLLKHKARAVELRFCSSAMIWPWCRNCAMRLRDVCRKRN